MDYFCKSPRAKCDPFHIWGDSLGFFLNVRDDFGGVIIELRGVFFAEAVNFIDDGIGAVHICFSISSAGVQIIGGW